jgi:putative restriction endonuclease
MSFWWVNHKQTYISEIEGGYIWSPKENSNGSKNQTYINLTETCIGDIILSYAGGLIKAIGVVSSCYKEIKKPSEFGAAGDAWSDNGWTVPINWEILKNSIRPKQYIAQIAPLLPKKHSPLQANGNGNQSCYLAKINEELGSFLLSIAQSDNVEVMELIESDKIELDEQKAVNEIQLSSGIEETEKNQIIKARKGQGKFRKNLEKVESKCRVTGVDMHNLLIASHIKPWRAANNFERLDGNNGLLLSPHIDKLFDQGWISFHDEGGLICANKDVENTLFLWGVNIPCNVGHFNVKQIEYLLYHRETIYKD